MNQFNKMIAQALTEPKKLLDVKLDGVNAQHGGVQFDAVDDFVSKTMKADVISLVKSWAETDEDDLGDSETLADRLFGLMIGLIDEDKDGELSDEEADMLDAIREIASDYLVSVGVDSDDVTALLDDWDDDVAETVASIVAGDERDVLDAVFDGASDLKSYMDKKLSKCTKVTAFRHGKKTIVHECPKGMFKLTSDQKAGLKLGEDHKNSPDAKKSFRKSMAARKKAGFGRQSYSDTAPKK